MPKSPYDHVKAWRARPENKGKRTEEARRYRDKYPEKVRAKARAYRASHPDYAKEQDARTVARRKADPEGQRIRYARWRAKKDAKNAALAGRPKPSICDLCRENNLRIVFDHCHAEGHFRGWLCDRCNKVLGLVRDDAKLLKTMARYLERKGNGKAISKGAEQIADLGLWDTGQPEVPDGKC